MQNTKTISIITLGCKVNQYESDSIALALENLGYNVLRGLQKADAYIINTCAVTNEGEKKSRGYIAKIKKQNPQAKIYVCGCASHFNPQNFENKPQVQFVMGTAQKMKIVDAIHNDLTGTMIINPTLVYDDSMKSAQTRTRAFIKIQDGCNSFCSYCIIPYLRGRSRSRTIESINNELNTIKSNEVVFAGVDVLEYGKDLPNQPTLVDVVELMRNKKARFRFSSLEMGSITPELLQHLASMPNFCPHFHLSMQSGSNSVLKRMNRKHSKEEFVQTVELIRSYFPNAGITTDVIVGFPGETDAEFAETIETIKQVNFYEMHVFPFSPREGTVAAKMKQIDGNTKIARTNILLEMAKQMKADFLKKQIGQTQEVLVESITQDNIAEGYSKNYVRTRLPNATNVKNGDIVLCKVTSANSDFVTAKLQK